MIHGRGGAVTHLPRRSRQWSMESRDWGTATCAGFGGDQENDFLTLKEV
jgi:hypothetical protein